MRIAGESTRTLGQSQHDTLLVANSRRGVVARATGKPLRCDGDQTDSEGL